jgi:hypothetical protein
LEILKESLSLNCTSSMSLRDSKMSSGKHSLEYQKWRNWYPGTWVPATYPLPWVTATSGNKLPATSTRVPDVPVAKVEDFWTDMD